MIKIVKSQSIFGWRNVFGYGEFAAAAHNTIDQTEHPPSAAQES